MKKSFVVTVVHMKELVDYPPVLSLIENLLTNGYIVNYVGFGVYEAPEKIRKDKNFHFRNMPIINGNRVIDKIKREYIRKRYANIYTEEFMKASDVLWTTTDISVRTIPKICEKYSNKHIMQLMELEEWYPRIVGINLFKFPIEQYARSAWKVVVPEINRAHIQQTWWNLKQCPSVLPNKPYSIEAADANLVADAVKVMKEEKRKIILYLGIIAKDRNIDLFADAIETINDEYCLYVAGKIDNNMKYEFQSMVNKYKCLTYLGNFRAPNHLALLKNAYIGLIPYYLNEKHEFISPLNVQYCAPNKIFEYSSYGIPMIGTNMMGLRYPFEKFNIGICCEEMNRKEIKRCIDIIENNYQEMCRNCLNYYQSVNLDSMLNNILS